MQCRRILVQDLLLRHLTWLGMWKHCRMTLNEKTWTAMGYFFQKSDIKIRSIEKDMEHLPGDWTVCIKTVVTLLHDPKHELLSMKGKLFGILCDFNHIQRPYPKRENISNEDIVVVNNVSFLGLFTRSNMVFLTKTVYFAKMSAVTIWKIPWKIRIMRQFYWYGTSDHRKTQWSVAISER